MTSASELKQFEKMDAWPKDIGILAMEFVFPRQYVDQSELEVFDGVSTGKYTIGLGQSKMGFCSDREDIHSMCLTAVHTLLEKSNVPFNQIGRLEIGTETIIDKSKSIKSVLMQLFESSGNTDIEGIDTTNACYGGTAAIFNAISWMESSYWDGRLAIVVAGDIAVYAKGPARPTGGAGTVAMLIGPDAPLVFDRGLRSSCMRNAYDFYKPDMLSEYPTVDSKLSIKSYLSAVDVCYQRYLKKYYKLHGNKLKGIDNFDAILLHSPYCKLVRKGFAHLVLNDFLDDNEYNGFSLNQNLQAFRNLKLEDTYFDRNVEKTFIEVSEKEFEAKTKPSSYVPRVLGNTYTACLYTALVSFLTSKNVTELAGNRILLFSYGSGMAASMFSITVTRKCGQDSALRKLIENVSPAVSLLDAREKVSPERYDSVMQTREDNYNKVPFVPQDPVNKLFPGTYYLCEIDDKYRRSYKRCLC